MDSSWYGSKGACRCRRDERPTGLGWPLTPAVQCWQADRAAGWPNLPSPCGVVQSVGRFGARTLDEPFPREFACLAVETLGEQFAAFEGSQEDVAPREDGRGFAGADGRSPKEVFLFAELSGETSVVRNSRA